MESEKITELKKILNEFAKESSKDVVIVIDDLDRARPDFALEIIEISKHIFDVSNISIVFVYDSEAMNSIASAKYGIRSGEKYLTKYIDNIFVHNDTELFIELDGYYFMTGFNSIITATAREKANFDEKYGLKYHAVAGGISGGYDNPDLFLIKGILTAIKICNPQLLKTHKDRLGSINLNDQAQLFELFSKGNVFISKKMKSEQLEDYKTFLSQLRGEKDIEPIFISLIQYVDNLPMKPNK